MKNESKKTLNKSTGYILLLSGPLCSGKSSLANTFLKNEKRLFRGSFDMIKRQISDFDSEEDRMLVKDLLFALSKEAVHKKLSIIVEGSANIMFEIRSFCSTLANKESIDFFEINLEAPIEVLQKRLQERVRDGKALTVTEPEQLLKRYNLYLERKDPSVLVYDSTKYSPKELYSLVKKDIFTK